MSLNVNLVVVGGDVKTTQISLKLPSIIGRGRGLAVVLPHPLVSRKHCELFESDGQLMVRDLGSLNGTFVNNERITESILGPDELLTIGTVTFRAVYEPEAGQAPAPSTLKGRPEKTVKVAKEATKPAAKASEPKKATQDSSGPLEFDFDESRATIVQPAPSAADSESKRAANRPAAKKADSQQPASSSAPDKKKYVKPPAADSESSDSEFEEPMSSSSDDDLNDFLDSLKDK